MIVKENIKYYIQIIVILFELLSQSHSYDSAFLYMFKKYFPQAYCSVGGYFVTTNKYCTRHIDLLTLPSNLYNSKLSNLCLVNVVSRKMSDGPINIPSLEDIEKRVTKSHLQSLCQQCSLSMSGSMILLLNRLRNYANNFIKQEKRRRYLLSSKVKYGIHEEGYGKVKYVETGGDNSIFYDNEESEECVYISIVRKLGDQSFFYKNTNGLIKNGDKEMTAYLSGNQNITARLNLDIDLNAENIDIIKKGKSITPFEHISSRISTNNECKTSYRFLLEDLVKTLLNYSFLQMKFDSSYIPNNVLSRATDAIRFDNGALLNDVLRQYECKGNYLQIRKVAFFLNGYRNAEDHKIARNTCSMLLGLLITDGVEVLDKMLSTMVKRKYCAGEINDNFLKYLDDIIWTQEKKKRLQSISSCNKDGDFFVLPNQNDINIQYIHDEELIFHEHNELTSEKKLPIKYFNEFDAKDRSLQGRVVYLLKLLRYRIKTEAAFPSDEKGEYLRLLVYCINTSNDIERKELIDKYLGSSAVRLNSFLELVLSYLDYVERKFQKLGQFKYNMLNIHTLRGLVNTVNNLRDQHFSMK